MKRKTILTFVLTGMLVAGGLFLSLNNSQVSAQSDTTAHPSALIDFGRGSRDDSEALAAALGITEEDLLAAKEAAASKVVDQALSLGLITQSQANALKAQSSLSRRDLYRLVSREDLEQIEYQAYLLEELGITEEEYAEAVASIQQMKLDSAIAEGLLTQEKADLIAGQHALRGSDAFKATMKSAYESAVQQALEDGTITQPQADALLARLDSSSFNLFGGPDGRHGRGDHRPGEMPGREKGFGLD